MCPTTFINTFFKFHLNDRNTLFLHTYKLFLYKILVVETFVLKLIIKQINEQLTKANMRLKPLFSC